MGTVFRVLVLSSATVRALRLAAASREAFSEEHEHRGRTRSGCRCSGFSNEHGFGRYCHPWESRVQVPWCYVDAACSAAGEVRSFRMRHLALALALALALTLTLTSFGMRHLALALALTLALALPLALALTLPLALPAGAGGSTPTAAATYSGSSAPPWAP